jgi:hypothetical protein
MPGVIPEQLKSDVIAAIESTASIGGDITPSTTLSSVGISGFAAESLASSFQDIARQFRPDASVARSVCGNLNTVADAIALVAKAAGFAG